MHTLAHWLPLVLIFGSELLGATLKRRSLDFHNILRDVFGQFSKVIYGAISKDLSFTKVNNSAERMKELKRGIQK